MEKGGLWLLSQILALRVYKMLTVTTISRLRLHVSDRVYQLFTAFLCARVNASPASPSFFVAPPLPSFYLQGTEGGDFVPYMCWVLIGNLRLQLLAAVAVATVAFSECL